MISPTVHISYINHAMQQYLYMSMPCSLHIHVCVPPVDEHCTIMTLPSAKTYHKQARITDAGNQQQTTPLHSTWIMKRMIS